MSDWCPENDGAWRAEQAAINGQDKRINSLTAEIERLSAALEAADAAAVRVKPLEWSIDPRQDYNRISASGLGVEYTIDMSAIDASTLAYLAIDGRRADYGPYPTLEIAKAAAQEDYARRILAAIEVAA